MTDYDILSKKASDGTITIEEVRDVAERLRMRAPDEDWFDLLRVLGKASLVIHSLVAEPWYRDVVEGFLEQEQDPALAWQAFEIVCNYWGDAERCKSVLPRFIDGVPWDQNEDARVHAILTAGSLLRAHHDASLLRKLIEIFENEQESPGRREDAYLALGRAMGWDRNKLPPYGRTFDLQKGIDPALIAAARERLSSEAP
jgi:hypothetical protein